MIRFANAAAVLALSFVVTACPNFEWYLEASSDALEAEALTEEQPRLAMELEMTVTSGVSQSFSNNNISIGLDFDTFFAEELSEVDILIEHQGEQLLLTSHELEAGETDGFFQAFAENFDIEFDEAGEWIGTFDITLLLISGGPVVVTPEARASITGDGQDEPEGLQVEAALHLVEEEAA